MIMIVEINGLYIPTVIKLKTIQFMWTVWMFESLNAEFMYVFMFRKIDLFLIYMKNSMYDTMIYYSWYGHSKLEKGGRKNLSSKNINNLKGATKAF